MLKDEIAKRKMKERRELLKIRRQKAKMLQKRKKATPGAMSSSGCGCGRKGRK